MPADAPAGNELVGERRANRPLLPARRDTPPQNQADLARSSRARGGAPEVDRPNRRKRDRGAHQLRNSRASDLVERLEHVHARHEVSASTAAEPSGSARRCGRPPSRGNGSVLLVQGGRGARCRRRSSAGRCTGRVVQPGSEPHALPRPRAGGAGGAAGLTQPPGPEAEQRSPSRISRLAGVT